LADQSFIPSRQSLPFFSAASRFGDGACTIAGGLMSAAAAGRERTGRGFLAVTMVVFGDSFIVRSLHRLLELIEGA
jgi:hypothetical protein